MNRGSFVRVFAAVLLLLPILFAGAVAAPAYGQPEDDTNTPPADVTLSWRALGLEQGMVLGPNSPTTFTVPVPQGLTASRLRGTIDVPLNIGAGFLSVEDGDGRILAAVDVPPVSAARAQTPLDVDLSTARVRASAVDLTFTVRPVDNSDQFCGPIQELSLSDMATVFTGAESPATTIANFFPPVLERVTIYAPADADAAEQQAVLTMLTALTRQYNPQPLAVSVVNQPRGAVPPPAPQLARSVVVEKGGAAGLSVQDPGSPNAFLRVAGGGDELSTQVSLLATQMQSLAQTASTRVDEAGADAALTGDTLTFDQLNMTGRTDVLKIGNFSVGAGRAALGNGRVDRIQVHLLADYTPVPKDDAAAVVIRSGDVVVYRSALDSSGILDATFDVDGRTFGQGLNLDFALTYTPQQVCGPLLAPISFQVNPRSTLTVHRGGAPLGGFSAFPSEFSPRFMVALDGSDPDQLIWAARIVGAIARLTSVELSPQVVDLKTAVDANTGALIVAKSGAIGRSNLNPPIGGDGNTVDVALPTELRADINDGIGSIQAFADGARDRSVILVTTTGAWSLVDPLFSSVDGANGNWSGLTGDVLAAGAAGTPTNLSIRAGDSAAESADASAVSSSPDSSSPERWIPIAVGVAAVVAVAALVYALLSRRRRAGGHDMPGGPPTTPEPRA
ncbi:hypothetical protein JRC04_28460 [Mycolicibacterium sp. S2-37]|uniref:hypothetical protein n=1 Tax=Mycolicibacterium sp. S2-37 TaxID=2810297 RepID=UPI001A93F4E8|nr:hypothetical protein [Mycolicibacterium sp. S2-37]MBO0681414.1 hypothetical protein [Mycolicibacterium sp. S2-37]